MPGEPRPDAQTKSITLKCMHCGHKFPAPILITPYKSFIEAKLWDNEAQCTGCGKMTGCDTEHFLAFFEGGGFMGNQYI